MTRPLPTITARRLILWCVLLMCLVGAAPPAAAQPAGEAASYAERPEVLALAAPLAELHGLDAAWVRTALSQARLLPTVQRLIAPPPAGTARNWRAYRERFIEPTRLRAGVSFWTEHARWLQQAQEAYGVPAELIVGIIGVETLYGRHTGRFRILDVLTTLAFDYPPVRNDRSGFFREELGQFLRLCQREGIDPTTPLGSFAGAMGLGQFMPSSWLAWAVDFDEDGRIDLHDSAADVIGSIANFLVRHGWTPGMPTHFDVAVPVDNADRAHLLGPDIVPTFSTEEFARRGAELSAQGRAFDGLLALVELQNGAAAPSYVAGTSNFFAVTRYNRSSYYALAVIELGAEVRRLVPQAVLAAARR